MRFNQRSGIVSAIVAAALFLSAAGRAQVVYSNFGPGDTYNTAAHYQIEGPLSFNFSGAVAFTPSSSGNLSLIEAAFTHVGGPNGLTLSLLDDSAGLPGAVLESWSFTGIADYPAGQIVAGTSVLTPTLTVGTTYWLAAFAPSFAGMGWWLNDTGAVGTGAFSPDGGASWSSIPGFVEGAFRITVTPLAGASVPEPGPIGMGSGMVLASLVWLRRLRQRA